VLCGLELGSEISLWITRTGARPCDGVALGASQNADAAPALVGASEASRDAVVAALAGLEHDKFYSDVRNKLGHR
jgi:hypothetical protein